MLPTVALRDCRADMTMHYAETVGCHEPRRAACPRLDFGKCLGHERS